MIEIYCTDCACRQFASKVWVPNRGKKGGGYWAAKCLRCGSTFGGLPPGAAQARQLRRTQERAGQLNLFSPPTPRRSEP